MGQAQFLTVTTLKGHPHADGAEWRSVRATEQESLHWSKERAEGRVVLWGTVNQLSLVRDHWREVFQCGIFVYSGFEFISCPSGFISAPVQHQGD